MAAARDPSLLQKCEQFLLHPTVRALSLAQRVDFLEKKGLSPEEITQCLKSVERRNGLSQLARRTAEELAAGADARALQASGAASAASKSPLQLLQLAAKKYGAVALLLMLLGYGYVQFRRRETQQAALCYQAERLQRRQRAHTRVQALLSVVKDQQKQYQQAAELLSARVAKYVAAQQNATSQAAAKASCSATQFGRGLELQALQTELHELKSAVVDTFLRPRVETKVVEVVKELPMMLRPAEVTVADRAARAAEVVRDDAAVIDAESAELAAAQVKREKKQPEMATEEDAGTTAERRRDQTTMTTAEITELFQRGQFDDELSTARSYHVLLATQ
ncbi:uncharacterized protein IUM83_18798 [Phytophthora cinnamomi]|uniref:uncharacterized protein n=1 Tax=Phytophthora cinnamomi TaxID=4785 RepID=UPI0035598407|nr:hypothetical protein IUM83_18798 [Phytophthora cinnamomi]